VIKPQFNLQSVSVGFYDALGAGWTYPGAYQMGCNAIALEGIAQESIPVLKMTPQQ
jgi:hypothetical protein